MTFGAICLAALWNGILTAISPCPLTTNITAISYLSKTGGSKSCLFNGLAFMIGRLVSFFILAVILLSGLAAASEVSLTLQNYLLKLTGPVFVLAGMMVLGLIEIPLGKGKFQEKILATGQKLGGVTGAFVLGAFLALAFCPLSAALFFSTIAMAAGKTDLTLMVPVCYGIGSALPVIIITVVMVWAMNKLSGVFETTKGVSWWATKISGALFLGVGIWYCLRYSLELF